MGYLVVEGPHDVELACRLLGASANFDRVREFTALEDTFRKLVPTAFPHKGDLLKRVPVPVFLQNETHGVAVQCAEGDSNLANCLLGTLEVLTPSNFDAIGALLDADSSDTPLDRHKKLVSELAAIDLAWPTEPGTIQEGAPRTGIYVLPDNVTSGTLEDLLVECGDLVYPDHMKLAREFIEAAMPHCPKRDFKPLHKAAGQKKALVGAVATLLKPGRAIQNSIQDNAWLGADAQKIARVAQLRTFFADLFSV
ncbi:DUF3226 domain-containing protein [Roseateles chitinivorans]|uniref:DUF3226 domain-containing protein n=1 Tax=Roseateles chitinivorans TaxID=2917965 RepID=UPI003D679275